MIILYYLWLYHITVIVWVSPEKSGPLQCVCTWAWCTQWASAYCNMRLATVIQSYSNCGFHFSVFVPENRFSLDDFLPDSPTKCLLLGWHSMRCTRISFTFKLCCVCIMWNNNVCEALFVEVVYRITWTYMYGTGGIIAVSTLY